MRDGRGSGKRIWQRIWESRGCYDQENQISNLGLKKMKQGLSPGMDLDNIEVSHSQRRMSTISQLCTNALRKTRSQDKVAFWRLLTSSRQSRPADPHIRMFTTCEHEVCSNDVSRGVKSEPWERRTTIRVRGERRCRAMKNSLRHLCQLEWDDDDANSSEGRNTIRAYRGAKSMNSECVVLYEDVMVEEWWMH